MTRVLLVSFALLLLGGSLASAGGDGTPQPSGSRNWRGFLATDSKLLQPTGPEWMVTPEVAREYYNSPFYSDDSQEKRPVVEEAAEGEKEKAGWFDSNRIMVGALALSGTGTRTFWLVQGLRGDVQYPVPVARPDEAGLVNISVEPERPALTRKEQIDKRDAVFPRWVWVVGVATSTLAESDVSGADEKRAYFLGGAWAINPYMSVIGGISNESPAAFGFSLDLGIVNFKP